jgi:hypothetical protein
MMTVAERSYPILSRVCIGVGIAFLAFSAFGNFRFGWSLGTNVIDALWLSAIYGGSDIAAGVLVATGSTMLNHVGWRWKVGGVVALVPALILISLSILSTFGMMSGRIAVLEGQKAAVSADVGRLAWLRRQTVNYDLPKSERRAFIAEERAAAKEARKAASVVTDNQAVAIANAAALVGVRVTTEQTQVGLTFVSSTMPMMIKFVCLGLGFFLYGARTEASGSNQRTQPGSGGSGGGEPKKPTLVHSEPKAEPPKLRAEPTRQRSADRSVFYIPATGAPERLSAFDLAYELALENPHLSTRALVEAAGKQFSQSTATRVKQRLRNKVDRTVRKFGNGEGRRALAYN